MANHQPIISLPILHGCNTIQLTRGRNTLVDSGDWSTLDQRNWSAKEGKWCYAITTGDRKAKRKRYPQIRMHRMILSWMIEGMPVGLMVDHKNTDSLDNRRANLRLATDVQNPQNSKKRQDTSSRYKGVYWHAKAKKWAAEIVIEKRWKYLGLFVDEQEAAAAYDRVAREAFGEFARLNGVNT